MDCVPQLKMSNANCVQCSANVVLFKIGGKARHLKFLFLFSSHFTHFAVVCQVTPTTMAVQLMV